MSSPKILCKGKDTKVLQKLPHLLHYIKDQILAHYFIIYIFFSFGLAYLGSDIFRNDVTHESHFQPLVFKKENAIL